MSDALLGYSDHIKVFTLIHWLWCSFNVLLHRNVNMLLHIFTVSLFTVVHFFSLSTPEPTSQIPAHTDSDLIFQNQTLHTHINMHIPHCVLGRSKFRGAARQTSANRLIMKAQSFIPWRRLAKNNWQAPRSLPLCHQG